MSRRKSGFWEGVDDGRTVADMSDVTRPSLFGHLPSSLRRERRPDRPPTKERPWEEQSMSPRERRSYVLGALGAALCIGLVYVVGLGLLILLMVIAWT
ncbi:MAG: type II secretion system protein M [Clostridiales bacterium]|nr:type II secretion system protein M [Clostridiales bacterium]